MSDSSVGVGPVQPQGIGEDPLSAYVRLYTKFLQLVFASFDKGSYQWAPDLSTTDILIQAENSVATDVVEHRPAIVVGRGPVAFTNIALDQFSGPLLTKDGAFTSNWDLDGNHRHTDLLSSFLVANCLSCQGLEAQRIAWICAHATRSLKRSLMKSGIHRIGEDLQISAESPPGTIVQPDPAEIILVSVTIPFLFQRTWTVGPNDKTLLTRINVALRSEIGATESMPSFNGPSINGRPLDGRSVPIDQILVSTTTGS